MTAGRFLPLLLGATLVASADFAQTHTQLLEKGIFLEDTAGDVDSAVRVYREIVSSRQAPSDVVALAQWRLAETLRRSQRAQAVPPPAGAPQTGCCGMFSGNYDPFQQITVVGIVRAMQWVNPQSILVVDGVDGNAWAFTLASPNAMVRGGLSKNTVRPGDQVMITGFLATGAGDNCPSSLPTACSKIIVPVGLGPARAPGGSGSDAPRTSELLHASAATITSDTGVTLFDRVTVEGAVAAQR